MAEYVSTFGVVRQNGLGEGRDKKYSVASIPALGALKVLEVVVDENGPVANVGSKFGKDAVALPAGAVVKSATLLTEVIGLGADIAINIVNKDGGESVALLAACTPAGANAVNEAAGAALGTRLNKDMYFTSTGTKTGYKGKLVVQYI